ncbi:WD40-repeat-containing domain protein [Mucor mucedo]|uniref:WD40-repeat-containing domain protein n=1 Tax=Mucor mucedo TaxID=29922 RepID=UPI00221F0501|nr:WD40-repeat-containing domain protein [Mucor mucedo]KAI7896407.1 WD40-repeat-containing domain protein [Mucor mucedo]
MDPGDLEITSPPSDGVSYLDFSPQQDYLAAASWDNQVRVYEVLQTGSTVAKVAYPHEAPVFCVKWCPDGTKLVSGGADNAARLYDVNTGQSQQIAQHSQPVKSVLYINENIVATGSWDKTIAYWDTRSPQPIGIIHLPERVYSMDSFGGMLVAGTADNTISIIDLGNPTVIFKSEPSPLKFQIRKVACFTVGKGYAVASIEGRVGIQYIDPQEQVKNFSFKCHRDEAKNIYSVNDISFHPVYGTFSTAGSDGSVNIWDKDRKQRLKEYPKVNGTISCTAFNRNGSILAYAVSYDWSKGYKYASNVNKIYLHAVKEDVNPGSLKKR